MNEKLVAFNFAEAVADPRRIRWHWGGTPRTVEFTSSGGVRLYDVTNATHFYRPGAYDRLRLVAKTREVRLPLTSSRVGYGPIVRTPPLEVAAYAKIEVLAARVEDGKLFVTIQDE